MPWIRAVALSTVLATSPWLSSPVAAGELTTRDLVELHRAGLGEEVLVALVEADGGPFHLTAVELIDLKAEGLTDRVLAALVRTGRSAYYASYYASTPRDRGAESDALPYVAAPAVSYHSGVTHIVEVPVAVPVYVLPGPRNRRSRFGNADPRATDERHPDRPDEPIDTTFVPTPGVARGPVTGAIATAAGIARARTATVDSIRHAPPGFHPGVNQSRPQPASAANPAHQTPPSSDASSAGRARPATPGVAHSARRPDPR